MDTQYTNLVRLFCEKLQIREKTTTKRSRTWLAGVGAGIAVDMQVAPANIYSMLMFMYDQLRKPDYSFLPFIAQEAWERIQYAFTRYLQLGIDNVNYAIQEGLEAGELLIDQVMEIGTAIEDKLNLNSEKIRDWWEMYETSIEEAKTTARMISKNPDGLRFAPPDVRARLLTDLFVVFDNLNWAQEWFSTADENIEDAILCILQWVQSKNEFEKIMQRTGVEAPVRPNSENKILYWSRGTFDQRRYNIALKQYHQAKANNAVVQKKKLNRILDGFDQVDYNQFIKNLPEKTPNNGVIRKNGLV